MKNKNIVNFGDSFSPVHDALVFEAEAYFKKLYKKPNAAVQYEVPVIARNGFIIGYVDLVIEIGWEYKIAIECKPTIESFGDLMRQLNTYKEHNSNWRSVRAKQFFVYSHDQKYAAQIESQGYETHPKKVIKRASKKL